MADAHAPSATHDPRTILVTGGGQGIGRGIALHLVQRGDRVVVAEVDEEAGREAEAALSDHGEVLFVHTDTSDEASVAACMEAAEQRFGALHGLINNAALADPYNGPVEELSLETWNATLGVNLTGYFLCAKHAVPLLRQEGGAIVNIASTRALQSEPHSEAYAATKGGVLALTHALAISLGPEIRVNAICPGWIEVRDWKKASERTEPELRPIDHEQHPVGRVGRPEDVAHLAAFLLSDEAGFITGQHLSADGGMTRKMIYAH